MSCTPFCRSTEARLQESALCICLSGRNEPHLTRPSTAALDMELQILAHHAKPAYKPKTEADLLDPNRYPSAEIAGNSSPEKRCCKATLYIYRKSRFATLCSRASSTRVQLSLPICIYRNSFRFPSLLCSSLRVLPAHKNHLLLL